MRRTKIVATLGPALDAPGVLQKSLAAGIDVVRANFSHGTVEDHKKRITAVRKCAKKIDRVIGILADLQGPKIRIARFQQGKVCLKQGEQFILDATLSPEAGTECTVGIDYKELPADVEVGDTLLLDDGCLVLTVEKIEGPRIVCRVEVGGELSNNKGINRRGGGLSAKALTEKDHADIKAAAALDVDYIAVSFPRSADDILEARRLIEAAGSNAAVIAKIERAEAVLEIDAIIEASDGVMVARGDLAVEIGDAEVPAVQKQLIQRARALNKPVITATQIMESMTHSPVPTRAEVSDAANAVLDTTDAVMVSAETATGNYPIKVIEALDRVCLSAESQPTTQVSGHRVECRFERVDEAIAMAAMYTANHIGIKAIIALTESGATPLWMSRIRSSIPIYGLSRNKRALGKMALYRDVCPISFDITQFKRHEVKKAIVAELERRGLVVKGDLVLLTKGDQAGVHGKSNAMKIIEVGNVF